MSVVITLKSLTVTNSENPTGADQHSLLILHNEAKGIRFHPAAALSIRPHSALHQIENISKLTEILLLNCLFLIKNLSL